MATTVEMPKLGNTVEDCLLSAWLKHEGDTVAPGEVIAEIETDKTSFEVTAPVGGVMLATFFPAGALVPVFTPICAIGEPGEAFGPTSPPAVAPPAVAPGSEPSPSPGRLSPRARRFAREHELGTGSVPGSGPGGRVLEADLKEILCPPEAPLPAGLVPVAPEAATSTGVPAALGQGQVPRTEPTGRPMSLVRQKIAERLRASLASTAQYSLQASANAGGLLAVRKQLKASPGTADVNLNDLVAFLTVLALREAPGLNAELVGGVVYEHADINLGFACDTDRGLVVPVVHRAQGLSLLGLARRMKELTAQALAGSIAPDDLNGGTFTVTNLGSLGIESFTPVLNPPQVAILGVDAIGVKAIRQPDGNICFIDSIGLSLTLDHQVVDGAPGARFLKVLREKIEDAEA